MNNESKNQVIGYTRSNKAIYNVFSHPAHALFTTDDHFDAMMVQTDTEENVAHFMAHETQNPNDKRS